jgi:uncharacterized membrane protein
MGENDFTPLPTAVYGFVLMAAGVAYLILTKAIIAHQGAGSKLKAAVGDDIKGKMSGLLYLASIPLAFVQQWISYAIFIGVALIWLVPDRRIESKLAK